jgi:acetyl-CoA carboxylase carboxyltransferase component
VLRQLVPENRVRAYDVRPVIDALADRDSVLELRPEFGVGIITALARLDGRPVGVIANNPHHLGGAIDGDAADKASRFLGLCQAHRLAIISLCDTPGFMVGPAGLPQGTGRDRRPGRPPGTARTAGRGVLREGQGAQHRGRLRDR